MKPQVSGSKGDCQQGAKKTSASGKAGSGNVKGGASIKGSDGSGGARGQKSGPKGG